MNKIEIEKSLCRAINQAPALDFEKLANMPVIKMTEHDYISRQEAVQIPRQIKMPKYYRQVSAVVAGCMVLLACITTWFVQFKTPDSIIALDANQSVEIVTNKQKQILSVKTYNKDAQRVINEQDFNQNNLEESIDVIVSAMIANGYLDENRNVIMVSVENQNIDRATDLVASLDQIIKDSASNQNITPTVLRQSVSSDQESLALAEQYQVSTGKVKIMKEIATVDESLSMETLAAMSVAQLLQISEEKSIDLTNIIKSDDQDPQVDNKKNDGTPNSETNGEPVKAPEGSVTETPIVTPAETKDPDAGETPKKEDGTTVTPVKEETETPDSNGVVTPPAGSETVTPPDSSGNITPPVADENVTPPTPEPEKNQTEVVVTPPQNSETETTDQDTPVPIKK